MANEAIGALGDLSKTSVVVDKLTMIAASDPNDVIRETAMRSLIRLSNDEKLVEKAWTTDGFNDAYRNMALNWWNEHDKDKAREICLWTLTNPTAEPTRVDAIRKLGSLKDKSGETRVYDALVAILKETSFGARSAAINSLGAYGNPAAIALLRQFQTHSLVFYRGDSDQAISQLGGK